MVVNFPHHRHAPGPPVQGIPDFQQNPFAIGPPLTVPETHFFNSLGEQIFSALNIVLPLLWKTMLGTIQLDGEFCCRAKKSNQ